MSCKCFDQKPQCRPTDDFHDKPNLSIIGAIVSTGYPANDATYRRRVMEISKRFQQYHLRIERKTFEMRYVPETDRCLGKGEK